MFHENMSLAELTEVAPLARGGFCVICSCVYRGRRAVLKCTGPDGSDEAIEDLMMEISIYKKIAQRGGHPNMALAYGCGFQVQGGKQTPFLVLERLNGGTLEKAFQQSMPLSDAWSDPVGRLPVAIELADAIAFLHHQAIPGRVILHRDLKPANIGLCGQGHVKVFDLGLSVVKDAVESSTEAYEMSGMAGSKRFMAPEVCSNSLSYNEKVDVYSFGLVLWQICTLRKPFSGMSEVDHYQQVVVGGLRPPLDPRWPAGLIQLLQACWHPHPDCRPSMPQARQTLGHILALGTGRPW